MSLYCRGETFLTYLFLDLLSSFGPCQILIFVYPLTFLYIFYWDTIKLSDDMVNLDRDSILNITNVSWCQPSKLHQEASVL